MNVFGNFSFDGSSIVNADFRSKLSQNEEAAFTGLALQMASPARAGTVHLVSFQLKIMKYDLRTSTELKKDASQLPEEQVMSGNVSERSTPSMHTTKLTQ